MSIIDKLFKKFEKREDVLDFDTSYRNDSILISIKKNGKTIPLSEVNEDNEISSLSESDIFDISEDGNKLILDYENIYSLNKETMEILKLPSFLEGAVYIDNSTYFLNINGVKFDYKIRVVYE